MHLCRVAIKNFRLLQDVELCLHKKATVIVGRNNSGKTSLTELFRRLTRGESPRFRLEDFSLGVHEQFWKASELRGSGAEEMKIRDALPTIDVIFTVDYKGSESNLGPLCHFVIDLNVACTEAKINVSYALEAGRIPALLDDLPKDRAAFFKELKERVPALYKVTVEAEDPNDATNKKAVELSQLRALLQFGYINAQRALDDTTRAEKAVIGKVLEALFIASNRETADQSGRHTAEQLKNAVSEIEDSIDNNFNTQLLDLIPAFELFGYPGLTDPKLRTETALNVETLLSNHTIVTYEGPDGVNLPESYNGLGPRNLIFILLKLFEFFRDFVANEPVAGTCLVFIEEPEAHLHPQMQSVFIRKLSEIAKLFGDKYNEGREWPVQFVVTTHSSHIANEAPFDSMRYFLAQPVGKQPAVFEAIVRDLSAGLGAEDSENRDFLHKYMTLTRCDLLFADRSILVEGSSERLLLPKMIEKIDQGPPIGRKLGSQYISIMEVGGAYAHIFFNLLDFLRLRTLIITDLDTINEADNNRKCKVSEGSHSSNACINTWYTEDGEEKPTKDQLLSKEPADKLCNVRRLAFQIPHSEGDACGRSFEDAFMLANPALFDIGGDTPTEREEQAWQAAKNIDKTRFALKHAIEQTDWVTPLYIEEGLRWLAASPEIPEAEAAGNAPASRLNGEGDDNG